MDDIKQYIIIRTDLEMSPGKIAVQASHASSNIFLNRFIPVTYGFPWTNEISLSNAEFKWINDKKQIKIVKKVKSEEKLLNIYKKAQDAGLRCVLIEDLGLTELKGKNYTAVAIGPDYVDKCEPIVKRLRNL